MADIDYADEIKSRVPIEDVIERYWEAPNSHGRVRCFIHNGKDKNMAINKHKGYVHCFVCNESRDVIGVVEELFNLDFIDACKKLDDDFNLGLNIGEPLSPEKKQELFIANVHREIHKLIAKIRKADEQAAFIKVCNALHKTQDITDIIQPHKKSDIDEQYDLYFDYLKKCDFLEWLADKLTGTDRDECEFDYKYGSTANVLYDKLIFGEIEI